MSAASFMALVAVGADYSMLFADRIREEAERGGMVRVVRTIVVPAGMVIIGEQIWWPSAAKTSSA